MATITLAPAHGLAMATIVLGYTVTNYNLMGRVMKARKQYDVKYPALYADSGHKNPTHAEAFNRVQRGHQNFLEYAPGFLLMALTSSLFYPVTSAAAVVIYYAGRLVYATGYAEKNEARNRGAFSYIGLLTLLGGALRGSVGLAMPIIRGALNI